MTFNIAQDILLNAARGMKLWKLLSIPTGTLPNLQCVYFLMFKCHILSLLPCTVQSIPAAAWYVTLLLVIVSPNK